MAEASERRERPGWEVVLVVGLLLAVLGSGVVAVTVFGLEVGPPAEPSAPPTAVAVDLDPLRLALGWGLAGVLLAVAMGIIVTTDWRGPDVD
ncbi:MAG: hypothetical protein R6X29_04440 [Acidimicrobiia bacterium]